MKDNLFNPSFLYEALKEKGLVPKFVSEDLGRARGIYRTADNTYQSEDVKNTLSHEFTHAVQINLLEPTAKYLAGKGNLTTQEQRFLDSYNKLMNSRVGGLSESVTPQEADIQNKNEEYIQSLIFDRLDENTTNILTDTQSKDKDFLAKQKNYQDWYKYRTEPDELQAWGVGFSVDPQKTDENVPTHVNPTMARELDMLLSMYKSLPKSVQEEAAVKRKADIKNYEFVNLKEDPFLNPLLK